MRKINKKVIISMALIIITMLILANSVLAVNPSKYDPSKGNQLSNDKFYSKAGKLIGWIQYIGIGVSVVTLAIIGIKYLISSVEGKAEYKKTAIPYVVGCFLLMGTSFILGLIADIV